MGGTEERGITWDLAGTELHPYQASGYLYDAGFHDRNENAIGCAVMYAESGWYLEAWHINQGPNSVAGETLDVASIDLGWIQRNVEPPGTVELAWTKEAVADFVAGMFTTHPDLAKPRKSAEAARQLFEARQWQPWVAFSSGAYKRYLNLACLAAGNSLGVHFGLGQGLLEFRVRTNPG